MSEEKRKVEYFNKNDINQLISETGLHDYFVEESAYLLLEEMGNHFVEEVLDTYKYKKKELTLKDIESAVYMKFPELCLPSKGNTEVMQRRVQQIDECEERVKEAEKLRNK